MDWTLEVVVMPVADIDRSIAFYRDQVGFHLDHDHDHEGMRVVQLTPPGSGCSIAFGTLPGMQDMEPGSLKGVQLVVSDADAARKQLIERGIQPSDIVVMDDRDGATFFWFTDPDGNSWTVQQIKARAERPLLPRV